MSYAKPKAMVIEQTYQSDFMRCFNISLHVICNMHMDYQLQALSMKKRRIKFLAAVCLVNILI